MYFGVRVIVPNRKEDLATKAKKASLLPLWTARGGGTSSGGGNTQGGSIGGGGGGGEGKRGNICWGG